MGLAPPHQWILLLYERGCMYSRIQFIAAPIMFSECDLEIAPVREVLPSRRKRPAG